MALATGTVWEFNASSTANMVNGGGFNPLNANFMTDLTTDANTANTNSPVVSSATYSFVAGDVGAWLYVKSGTNWTQGYYQIASVASNKATLSAAIGQAVQVAASGKYTANTVAGCATVGTPTGGTFGVDYSQGTTAIATATDYASVGATSTLTSVSAGFRQSMIGNIFHQTTTGTGGFGVVGWYEIVNYTNTSTVTLDSSPNSGTASVACTGFVGGALSLNSTLDSSFFGLVPAGSIVFFKNGSYTAGQAITVASANGTAASPIMFKGYNALRGDLPPSPVNFTNNPTISLGANAMSLGVFMQLENLNINGTAAAAVTLAVSGRASYSQFKNSSVSAARVAIGGLGATAGHIIGCEAVSQNGTALTVNNSSNVSYCFLHDSASGASGGGTGIVITNTVMAGNTTAGFASTSVSGANRMENCTIYGRPSQVGTGVNFTGANSPSNKIFNTIIAGCTTGISVATGAAGTNLDLNCDFFNNGADTTNWVKSSTALALDPQFTDVTELSGSTATTSGSVLTATGFSAALIGRYLHVVSGTGVTVGCYLITGATSTTLTVNNALGTSSGGDVVWWIRTKDNFSVGTNMKAAGFAGYLGTETTSYMDVGGVQRQEAGAAGMLFIPCLQAL